MDGDVTAAGFDVGFGILWHSLLAPFSKSRRATVAWVSRVGWQLPLSRRLAACVTAAKRILTGSQTWCGWTRVYIYLHVKKPLFPLPPGADFPTNGVIPVSAKSALLRHRLQPPKPLALVKRIWRKSNRYLEDPLARWPRRSVLRKNVQPGHAVARMDRDPA